MSFDLYYYYVIYILFILKFIFSKKTLKVLPMWFLMVFLTLTGTSLVAASLYGTGGFGMFKQIFGITFTSVAYWSFFSYNNFDIKKLFGYYVDVAVFVALLGIFDEFFHILGIHLTQIKQTTIGFYRVYSVMGEPYFLAVVLLPALFYCFNKTFGKRNYRDMGYLIKTGILALCTIFTFSTAGYMGMLLILTFWLYNKGYFSLTNVRVLLLPLIVFFVMGFLGDIKNNVKEISIRIEDTMEAFTTRNLDTEFIMSLNSSTFALYSNYMIAEKSFTRNPYIGGGLGSHVVSYDMYFGDYFEEFFLERFGDFNKQDANSLFLRLMSETGLLGLILFFFYLFRFFVGRKKTKYNEIADLVLINHGVLILMIIRLLRTGNYLSNGFFFFFFLYVLCWRAWKQYKKEGKLLTTEPV